MRDPRVEKYAHGDCHLLAVALSTLTDLPVYAAIGRDMWTENQFLIHAWVALPCGRALDANGVSPTDEMLLEYPDGDCAETIQISHEAVTQLGEGNSRRVGKKALADALTFAAEVIKRNGGADLLRKKERNPGPHPADEFVEAISPVKDQIYEKMLNAFDCGPFDGGCLLAAKSLQEIFGGDLQVLLNEDGGADHVALMLEGRLIDFDGPLEPIAFMQRYSENEGVRISGFRPLADGDLPLAARDEGIQAEVTALLRSALVVNRQSQRPEQVAG